MNQTTAFSNIGTLRLAVYDALVAFHNRPFFDTGNNDQIDFTVEEEVVELPDARELGGIDATMRRVKGLNGTIKMRHISEEMLPLVLYGTANAVAVTAITDEAHVAHAGRFVPTVHLIDLTQTITVKKGVTALDAADWEVEENGGGIKLANTFATSGLIEGDAILISYTPAAQYDIEALVTNAPQLSVSIVGQNAYNGLPCRDELYKIRLGAVQNYSRVNGGQFGEITISFSGEKDATITTAGKSKYYKHTEGKAAA